jgi:periplasmic protein TonB
MKKFLPDNIRYPIIANKSGIQGTVHVTFVIERDGSVTYVKILRGIVRGCDEEALPVVRDMPRWEPGRQRGKPVQVQYIICFSNLRFPADAKKTY